jgi:hypothetical protein
VRCESASTTPAVVWRLSAPVDSSFQRPCRHPERARERPGPREVRVRTVNGCGGFRRRATGRHVRRCLLGSGVGHADVDARLSAPVAVQTEAPTTDWSPRGRVPRGLFAGGAAGRARPVKDARGGRGPCSGCRRTADAATAVPDCGTDAGAVTLVTQLCIPPRPAGAPPVGGRETSCAPRPPAISRNPGLIPETTEGGKHPWKRCLLPDCMTSGSR